MYDPKKDYNELMRIGQKFGWSWSDHMWLAITRNGDRFVQYCQGYYDQKEEMKHRNSVAGIG
jgi:hypothetical protein